MVASRYPHNKELIWGLTGKNINSRIQGRIPAHIFQTGNKTSWAGGFSAISPTLYTIEHFYTEDGVLPERPLQQAILLQEQNGSKKQE